MTARVSAPMSSSTSLQAMLRRSTGATPPSMPAAHQGPGAKRIGQLARRKMAMSWADTHALLTMLRGLLTVHPLTVNIHETGLGLAECYGLSTWDAMIAARRFTPAATPCGRRTCNTA
jgi:hypothetical protein